MNAKGFYNGVKTVEYGLIKTRGQLDQFRKGVFKLGATLQRSTTIFSGWAMSVMFMGMALSRMFSRILKGAVSTFTKIMESSGSFGSSIQQLAVHWEYLKFVIGSAINRFLEPLMPRIIKIINALSEWIQKHPKLAANIIIWGLIIGTAIMVLGMLVLGLKGTVQGLIVFGEGIIWLIPWIKKLTLGLWGVGKAILKWVLPPFKDLFVWLTTTFIGKGVLGLIAAILYLGFKWNWQWKAMLANAAVWGLKLTKWITKIAAGLVGVFDLAWAGIKDGLAIALNWVMKKFADMMNWLIRKLPKKARAFFGVEEIEDPFQIRTDAFAGALDRFKRVQEGIDSSFDKKIKQWEDVMAAWEEAQKSKATREAATGMAAWTAAMEAERAAGVEAAGAQSIAIDTLNVNSDAVSVEQLMEDMKRYASITNTEL